MRKILGFLLFFLLLCLGAEAMVTPGITYSALHRQFTLQGPSSSYVFKVNTHGLLEHLHWGAHVHGDDEIDNLTYLGMDTFPRSFDAGPKNDMSVEWADYGTGDFRAPSFRVRYANGTTVSPLVYVSHSIIPGKSRVDPALPATYVESTSEATSLQIILEDEITKLQVHLWYTQFHEYDIITRQSVVVNSQTDGTPVTVEILNSATLDFPLPTSNGGGGWHFSHLAGAWARERHFVTHPLFLGSASIQSRRGVSGHQHNPFALISDGVPHEEHGEHYAVNLVYTGNFLIDAEIVQTGRLRVQVGINPFNFAWKLGRQERFSSPEVVLAYSGNGYGEISRQMHKLYRTRLARGYWRDLRRPILVNSWEAMYFDVSEEKVINNLAVPAAELGIELVVLDDGWFGERNNDRSSLGDWYVNTDKFPNGLGGLANQVNALGLSFGIWMEPEMISADSNLYRAHPDWALHTGDRDRTEGRNQLVLDLSRPDVCDFIVDAVTDVLNSGNIEYLKWDFNRHLTEVSSETLPVDQQAEVSHRFILGLYSVLERLTERFPKVLFESCSGGGGRYDPGMLFYMPQSWSSDNTDAVARAKIQYGSSIPYPVSAMGAHVSVTPNHQTGRVASMITRSLMALAGTFGYELDLLALSTDDKILIKQFVALHADIESIVRTGNMYRLQSPFNSGVTSWMFVSEDLSRAAVFAFNNDFIESTWNYPRLKLRGLQQNAVYRVEPFGAALPFNISARTLTSAGLPIMFESDAQAFFYLLQRVSG